MSEIKTGGHILDTDERLKDFGYIKGGYMWGDCRKCKGPLFGVAKYSWHCFKCASAMLKAREAKP